MSAEAGAHECAAELCLRELELGVGQALLVLERFLRARQGAACARLIDVLRPFPSGSHQTHVPVQHAEQAAHAGCTAALTVGIYNVRLAQHLIPATDLDEQISQAGKEASGTGNMKFALNGAMTVGTLDGANVEIRERVGAENFFLFGMTVDEVEKKYAEGYNPASYYEADPRLKHAIDMVADGTFSNGDRNAYSPLVADWLTKDWFMTLADFSAYMDIQSEIEALYADELEWNRKALLNTASSGWFSSDRTIREYRDEIWHA